MEISVVVPVHNEALNVAPLVREIEAALSGTGRAYEIIFVDDHSRDDTLCALQACKRQLPALRVISHDVNCGQSSAIRTGVLAAKGTLIITLDGDGQNDPADIPKLLACYDHAENKDRLGMVGGRRVKRQDNFVRRVASRWANGIRSRMLRDGAEDVGCGLKLIPRAVFLRLPYFDHMHRFIVALVIREGFEVHFVDVNHRPRLHGKSNYGVLDRLWVSIGDLFGVMWLNRRCRLPRSPREI